MWGEDWPSSNWGNPQIFVLWFGIGGPAGSVPRESARRAVARFKYGPSSLPTSSSSNQLRPSPTSHLQSGNIFL